LETCLVAQTQQLDLTLAGERQFLQVVPLKTVQVGLADHRGRARTILWIKSMRIRATRSCCVWQHLLATALGILTALDHPTHSAVGQRQTIAAAI